MTDEMIALSRRAVACKGWRWMPGMHAVDLKTRSEARVMQGTADLIVRYLEGDRYLGGSVPDLTDPATLGCLLALVREAWGDPGMFALPRGRKVRPDWAVFAGETSDLVCAAPTEAEALVAALESAP